MRNLTQDRNPLGTMPEHAALVAAFQSADHITLSNNEDGVAKWLMQHYKV